MEFLFGMLLVGVAGTIWFTQRRRPVRLRTVDDATVLAPSARDKTPRPPPDATAIRRIARVPAPSDRLAAVMPGDQLRVGRSGDHWIIADDEGRIAHVGRPGASPQDPKDALTAAGANLPPSGTLYVDRVLHDADGNTVDLRGMLHPDEPPTDDVEDGPA